MRKGSLEDPENKSEDYVGYKHPPKATRFRKGKSGNPAGRRKKAAKSEETLQEMARRILTTKLEAMVRGKLLKMTYREAILQKLARKAVEGDIRATKTLFELGAGKSAEPAHDQSSDVDLAIVSRLIARNQASNDDRDDHDADA